MAERTEKTKELTSTQEGIIAGLVILFFGLLYWYLNPWQSEQKNTLTLTEQPAIGKTQGNSLASPSNEQPPSSTTGATASTPETRTPASTVASGIAPSTTPATTASATDTTKAASFAKLPPPPGPVEANKAETVVSSSPTTVTTETAQPTTETNPPAATTASNPILETLSSSSTETATAKPIATTPSQTATEAKPVQVAANTAQTTEATAVSTAAIPTEPIAQTANTATTTPTTTTPETNTPSTAVNKLELAPGSPEAKLQAYLDTKTLETPVGMDGISFESKTSKLTKESDPKVLLLAALLAQYPEANFLITAYTTESGAENKDSDSLSLLRAQILGENLVKAGVDAKRITIMGMGKRLSPDKTSVASKQSQRIEISVIE